MDRFDSSLGYTKENIQIMSHKANIVKSDLELSLFRTIVENLKQYTLVQHDIDDTTRQTIINDRDEYINNSNRQADRYRLMNLENQLLLGAKKRAKKNSIELDIDCDYIKSIFPLDNKCPIVDHKFVFGENFIMSDYSATIDRIDNNKGYVKGNVMIISAKVNSVKSTLTVEELELMLRNWEELENNRKEKGVKQCQN